MPDPARYDGRYPEPPYTTGDDATAELAVLLCQRDAEIETLRKLVADLSSNLTDEGAEYSTDGLHDMRCRVAVTLPVDLLPDWLLPYRDQPDVTPGTAPSEA